MAAIVRRIEPDQLTLPTPCSEYDVRALVHHVLFWGPPLVGAGRGEAVPTPAAEESDVDLAAGDWRADLLAHLARAKEAWQPASAWEGTTFLGSSDELPATVAGYMLVGELVLHGWDLARATGQELDLPEDLLNDLYDATAEYAEQGREMGIFGPEVPVPDNAPVLHRILGMAGRDPAWVSGGAAVPSAAG
jgi:uncharacterized protein (TIGR03086 family)